MVSHTLGKIKVFGSLTLVAALTLLVKNPVMADGQATLRTVVDEMLTVSLEQTTASTMEYDGLVRNKVGLIVTTNNPGGFTASMTTADAAGTLKHSTRNDLTIPVLNATTTRSSFGNGSSCPENNVNNCWGFSVDDTDEGSPTSSYKTIAALGATAPSFITSTSSGGAVKDIYFGAKAAAAGSYSNSVIISVVSGIDTTEPTTPTNPVTPSDDPTPNDNSGEYISNRGDTGGSTVGRVTTSTGTTSKTVTQMTKGDTTSSYTDPQGVTNTVASINEGTPLATGLAVTAAVAAVTGIGFFILAKRRKEDDDEEDADY